MIRLEMKHYNMILTKKLKNNIKKELLLLKALSSGKIDKYKFLLTEKNVSFQSKPNNRTS